MQEASNRGPENNDKNRMPPVDETPILTYCNKRFLSCFLSHTQP